MHGPNVIDFYLKFHQTPKVKDKACHEKKLKITVQNCQKYCLSLPPHTARLKIMIWKFIKHLSITTILCIYFFSIYTYLLINLFS